jgi:16S rRNA (uracil1498-N3)-methyltransferase
MRIPRLYIDLELVPGETISLPRDKAHHISHVLRMHVGDEIKLFNDSGSVYDATIVEITKKLAEVEVRESLQVDNESSLNITLCLAILRTQQMDFSIQKAVELGVKNIVPVISEFSNFKSQESRVQNKLTHWQNIIISATEQCGRNRLTQLQSPISFSECLTSYELPTRLILHPSSQRAMPAITLENNELLLMIGPEGGFSQLEVNEAEEKACISISLGPRILRAETAVVSALSNAQQLWGDLN